MMVYSIRYDQYTAPDSAARAAPAQPVFGLGRLPPTLTPQTATAITDDAVAGAKSAGDQDELFTTEQQDLIVNPGFLYLLNSYLLPSPGAAQVDALNAHLKTSLPPKAFAQAAEIVQHYRHYIIEHDQLLDAQGLQLQSNEREGVASLNSLDVNRIVSWQQQRLRLRERLLGEDVTIAWFQNDDANLLQAIDDLKLLRAMPDSLPLLGAPRQAIDRTTELESAKVMHAVLTKACRPLTSGTAM